MSSSSGHTTAESSTPLIHTFDCPTQAPDFLHRVESLSAATDEGPASRRETPGLSSVGPRAAAAGSHQHPRGPLAAWSRGSSHVEGLDTLHLGSSPAPVPVTFYSPPTAPIVCGGTGSGPLAVPGHDTATAMPAMGTSVGHSGASRLLAAPAVFFGGGGGMNGSISGADSVGGFDGDESLDSSPKVVASFGARASSTAPHSLRATPCGQLGLTEVVPNLYLGSFRAVRQVLTSPTGNTRLHALVCVAKGLPRPLSGLEEEEGAATDLLLPAAECCHHFELLDDASQAIVPAAQQVCAIIDQCLGRDQAVAIYCQAGKSRSVSCVLFWLMTRRNISFDAAMTFLRRVHPSAEPNIHFIEQLRQHTVTATST